MDKIPTIQPFTPTPHHWDQTKDWFSLTADTLASGSHFLGTVIVLALRVTIFAIPRFIWEMAKNPVEEKSVITVLKNLALTDLKILDIAKKNLVKGEYYSSHDWFKLVVKGDKEETLDELQTRLQNEIAYLKNQLQTQGTRYLKTGPHTKKINPMIHKNEGSFEISFILAQSIKNLKNTIHQKALSTSKCTT